MLSETAIIEINKILELCDSYYLNQLEINQLNQLGADPTSTCDYYDTAQTTLTNRSKTDTSQNLALEMLLIFADNEGCAITLEPAITPTVYIPVLGGSI